MSSTSMATTTTPIQSSTLEVKSTTPLFIEASNDTAIIVWDVSGSTSNVWDSTNICYLVYDEMAKVVKTLKHKNYRFVFWNSPSTGMARLQNGVMVLPFVVYDNTIDGAIQLGRSVISGSTCPSVGLRAIPQEWFANDPMVYLITDGQIGASEMTDLENKKRLAECIKQLPVQLTIIAVENQNRDFSTVENVQQAAGGDIYAVIQRERLTNKVSKFVSYALNGSTVQIDKVKPPAGYAPYGNKYFSMLRTAEFIDFLRNELDSNRSVDNQMAVAQKLSATLEALTRDKPTRVTSDIIRTFANMFTADQNMVQWIITDGVERERGGQAQVIAHFRGELKNLFAQADSLLKRDVCGAVGMNDGFVSCIIEGHVLNGSYRLVDKTVCIAGANYPRAGVTEYLPVLPRLTEGARLTDLQDQCLRQWIRQVYASVYKVHPTADEIIYLVLGDMLKVVSSGGINEDVKTAYRQLARCILRKKRLNSIQTEMDVLIAGDLPIPNSGKIEDFFAYMNSVGHKTGIKGSPLRVWYAICQALDPLLAIKQERHCTSELGTELVVPPVVLDAMPDSATFDYTCIVTLEDISSVGGWRILPHIGSAGNCAPVYLLSDTGRQNMMASGNCMCPLCYKALNADGFVREGPKVAFDMPELYKVYADRYVKGGQPASYHQASQGKSARGGKHQARISQVGVQQQPIRNANGNPGKLVIMKGPVGCGKSTMSANIKAAVEARGGVCIVEGPDKYAKSGMPMGEAVNTVREAIRKGVTECKNDDLVVIIDTCGDYDKQNDYTSFEINFNGWTKFVVWPNLDRGNLPGYFAWSLRNVLRRVLPGPNDNFNLNPISVTADKCIMVHRMKCKALLRGEYNKFWKLDGSTVQSLSPLADAYAARLSPFAMPAGL